MTQSFLPVARGNIGNQGAQHIEWRSIANLDLFLDVHFDLVHGNVPGTFDHHLRTLFLAALS